MTKRSPQNGKGGGYAVGYRRPPKHSIWKPGQSGNPRGRKKGSRSAAVIFRSVLGRKVTIQEGGKTRRVPLMEAVFIRLAQDALKGNPKAIALLIKLAQTFSTSDDTVDQHALTSQDEKLLSNYIAREMRKKGDKQ